MVIESKVAKAKVTESNTGWIEIPEHDPALQVKLCKRIFENSADVEARGLLAVNNLRYAGKVAEAFSSALREEYGFTPSEINSKTAEFTMRAAMSPSYVATRPFKNYLASTVMFGFRNLIRDLKRRNISYSLESYLVDEEENLDKLGFMEDKSVPLPSRGAE
ncbi:hypothetical protein KA107_03785, partial [Candidatus Pacearchaeota archaeon]|nr:hypothetical protein [Candidatus Pacearchaeota archaeon]